MLRMLTRRPIRFPNNHNGRDARLTNPLRRTFQARIRKVSDWILRMGKTKVSSGNILFVKSTISSLLRRVV